MSLGLGKVAGDMNLSKVQAGPSEYARIGRVFVEFAPSSGSGCVDARE
jgi:hypothetical protein